MLPAACWIEVGEVDRKLDEEGTAEYGLEAVGVDADRDWNPGSGPVRNDGTAEPARAVASALLGLRSECAE